MRHIWQIPADQSHSLSLELPSPANPLLYLSLHPYFMPNAQWNGTDGNKLITGVVQFNLSLFNAPFGGRFQISVRTIIPGVM